MPASILPSLNPRQSLRRLRTVFGPSSPTRSASAASATSPQSSPLSASTTASSQRFSGFNFDFTSNGSSLSLDNRLDTRRVIRRKKSMAEVEQEAERTDFNDSLVGLVEPRPYAGPTLGGIEEVLDGRV